MSYKTKAFVFLVVFALLLVGCGPRASSNGASGAPAASGEATPTRPPRPTATPDPDAPDVEISVFAYSPETLIIQAGDTVTWKNMDVKKHTITSDDDLFDSGDLEKGEVFRFTFEEAGTYEYHCERDARLHARVIVQ